MAACNTKRIARARTYVPKVRTSVLPNIHTLFFLAAYLSLGLWIAASIGKPYKEFLEKAEAEGFEVMEDEALLRAEAIHAFKDIDDPNRRAEKTGWFDWMDMDIEDYDEVKKREKEKNFLDSLPKKMRVPSRYSPGFWPLLSLGIACTLHLLLQLMQVWRVGFNVGMNYRPIETSAITAKSKAVVRISPTTSKDELLPIEVVSGLGLVFEWNRRKFVYEPDADTWVKIRARSDMKTSLFARWNGFQSAEKLDAARLRFGENIFAVKQPEFLELYKKQLLSPFTVFQLFTSALWLMDSYWQYSAFSLFMILVFEGTVVLSRIKSIAALKGMGNAIKDVHVYRLNKWMEVKSDSLVPGDIISVVKGKGDGGEDVVADVVMLRGSSVVSEASLTGESVPQMKEGLAELNDESLAIKAKHKSAVLYAGTKMLSVKGSSDDSIGTINVPSPPDNGAVCFVLRTGFLSAQGKLVRMIESSQEKVKGEQKEIGLLLLFLLVFAMMSSGYVLKHGWHDENRSNYEVITVVMITRPFSLSLTLSLPLRLLPKLLLHCILIITSVIPPELPMQLALAVNQSLMTLMKLQIFCTEPNRVPLAGKLDSCLFDKTGTLTTDELVAVGVVTDFSKINTPTPMTKVTDAAGLVLTGCNSLLVYDKETTGDPLEAAAVKSMRWEIFEDDNKSTYTVPKKSTEKRPAGSPLTVNNKKIEKVEVVSRHHFASKLQRMSTITRDVSNNRYFVVCKGSPEAIGERLVDKPEGYEEAAKTLAKKGLRVISLCYKEIESSDVEALKTDRASCELRLKFAGFIAFTCRVRKDTKAVLAALTQGGLKLTMVTGDNLLTAAHVAKEVDICKKPILILDGDDQDNSIKWLRYDDNSTHSPFDAGSLPSLAAKFDLSTTGKNLQKAFASDEATKRHLNEFRIFARMTPSEKETVIDCLHDSDHVVLMCGDGANDVGALKQADVGVALLSGFGDVNVDKGEDGSNKQKQNANANANATAIISAEEMEKIKALPVRELKTRIRQLGCEPDKFGITDKSELVALYRKKQIESAVSLHDRKNAADKKKEAAAKAKQTQQERMQEKQRRMVARVQELEAQGERWAQFKVMKEFMSEEMNEAKKKKAEMSNKGGVANSASRMAAQLEDLEDGELPTVKIGDASIAAPFTSKMPSIRSCVDIIRQGRCTLVTSSQMHQILALNCLISAYSLSVLYLDGVKYGDTQMTAMGILGSISYMSMNRSKPLNKLSPVRPLTSIFHPSLFLSLLGQFAVHLGTMFIAVRAAKVHQPADFNVDLDGIFKPGIVNSVVFLVSNVQQVCVFVVNLKGHPFMSGLTENAPLLYSLVGTFLLTFIFGSETVPGLNKYFQLVPFPDEEFRSYILAILAADVVLTFCWDRLMQLIFAPRILWASMEGTSSKDVVKMVKVIGVIAFLMYQFLGDDAQWEELMKEDPETYGYLNETADVDEIADAAAAANVGAEL